MGIKNLKKFLDKYAPSSITEKTFEDYKNKTIAIDTSLVLYKYITAMRKSGKDLVTKDGTVTSHLHGLLFLINKLISHKITPIFVFDGKAPDIKKDTLSKRYDNRKEAEDKLSNMDDLSAEERIMYFIKSTKLSGDIIKNTKLMLSTLGIPFIDSPEEADAQMVCLLKNNLVHAVATEDMDLLTFGADRVLKNFFSTKENKILEINREKMLKEIKLSQKEFIDLTILLGCDYLPTLYNVGFVKSYLYMSKYKSIDKILEIVKKPENYDYEVIRDYFETATNKCNVPKESDMKISKVENDSIYGLLVDKFEFTIGKYNSFIISRNKYFA
jgi:flap endonuclease-1